MGEHCIYEDTALIASGKPVMHAIVIAVEYYPDAIDMLGSLSSPSHSARALATWLLDANTDPTQPYPLASLSLLIGQERPQQFNHAKTGPVQPKDAHSSNVRQAIIDWATWADNNEDNLTLFYFCGHGITDGYSSQSLLLSDFHKDPFNPMDGAVDFKGFVRGMRRVAPSRQMFFVDACRSLSDIATDTSAKGHPLIQPNRNRTYSSVVEPAIFYATVDGEKAYGKRDSVSFFSDALIKGLNGIGSHNREADQRWRVSTGMLNQAIKYCINARNSSHQMIVQGHFSEFDFHILPGMPETLVLVSCNDGDENHRAIMACYLNENLVDSRPVPSDELWETLRNPGPHKFEAKIDINTGVNNSYIIPPYKRIDVKVQV